MIFAIRSSRHLMLLPLTVAVCFANQVLANPASAPSVALAKVVVTGETVQSTTENTELIAAQDLENNQARSWDDLVRYVPGVAVDDSGRFGSTGFNIRGMDGDRVAITVDGLSLGEILNPASNAPYEFFAAGRSGIDIDAMKSVEVIKGADSITAGNGSLGGAVVFVTKDPSDYLNPEGNDTYVGIKTGYSSANEEGLVTGTLANRTGHVESLLVYTRRDGHETESWYSGKRPSIAGTAREIPDPLDYTNDNLLFKLYLHASEQHRFGLVVERFNGNSELDNQTRLSSGYLTRTTDDTSERERYGVNYLWKADNAFFDELDVRYDYQTSYSLGHTLMTVPSGCPAGADGKVVAPCLRAEHRDFDQELHKVLVHADKRLAGHAISYGFAVEKKSVDYADVKTRYVGTTPVIGTGWPQLGSDFVPNTDIDAWNIYLRDQWSLVDNRLTVNAGVRYDHYEYSPSGGKQFTDKSGTVGDVSFSSPTWQLGASWALAPQHSIWIQTGAGFRAPSVENMYFSPSTSVATQVSTGQLVDLWNTVANPNLESEKSRTIEVGYRWQGDRHLFGVSAFRNEYSNFIEYATFMRNATTEYQTCNAAGTVCNRFFGDEYQMLDNIGEVTVEGIEAEARVALTPSLSARAAWSWTQGELKDGTPLQSIMPDSGVAGLIYDAPGGVWGASLNLVHSANKSIDDAVPANKSNGTAIPPQYFERDNSFTVVDLQGHYQITRQLRLNMGVYNLFNEEYMRWQRIRFANQGSVEGGARGGISADGLHRYTEPGRNYKVTFSYEF